MAIIAAVMVANLASFAFFMGAMRASKLQKNGARDNELPWWVYLCLIAPPLMISCGAFLLT